MTAEINIAKKVTKAKLKCKENTANSNFRNLGGYCGFVGQQAEKKQAKYFSTFYFTCTRRFQILDF